MSTRLAYLFFWHVLFKKPLKTNLLDDWQPDVTNAQQTMLRWRTCIHTKTVHCIFLSTGLKSSLRCFCSLHYVIEKSFHLKPNKRHDNENQWPQMSNCIFEREKKRIPIIHYFFKFFANCFFTSWEPLAGICIPNWKLTAAITESIYYHITITNSNWWRKSF